MIGSAHLVHDRAPGSLASIVLIGRSALPVGGFSPPFRHSAAHHGPGEGSALRRYAEPEPIGEIVDLGLDDGVVSSGSTSKWTAVTRKAPPFRSAVASNFPPSRSRCRIGSGKYPQRRQACTSPG